MAGAPPPVNGVPQASPTTWTAADTTDAPQADPQIKQYPYLQRAVLEVNGERFWEWETIQVRHAIHETPPYTARFTCSESERAYPAIRWAWRIKPGDHCTIKLDGWLALTGFVTTRQAFYDAHQHTVEIQVTGLDAMAGHTSVQHKSGEEKNKKPEDIAKKLGEQLGLNLKVMGGSLSKEIDRFSIRPGETMHNAMERLARTGNFHMTADEQGNMVWLSQPLGIHSTVVEGINILEGREIIHSLSAVGEYTAQNQGTGSDDLGKIADWTHQRFHDQAGSTGFSPGKMAQTILTEIPAFQKGLLESRAKIESNVNDMYQIWVTVTTLGWQRPEGGLWVRGQIVHVDSPMLIMNRDLVLKAVTFSQDNQSGTRSTLELVNRAALGGYADASE